MDVLMYLRMHACVCVCVYVYVCTYTHIRTYVCMHAYIQVCQAYTCTTYVCMYVCMYLGINWRKYTGASILAHRTAPDAGTSLASDKPGRHAERHTSGASAAYHESSSRMMRRARIVFQWEGADLRSWRRWSRRHAARIFPPQTYGQACVAEWQGGPSGSTHDSGHRMDTGATQGQDARGTRLPPAAF